MSPDHQVLNRLLLRNLPSQVLLIKFSPPRLSPSPSLRLLPSPSPRLSPHHLRGSRLHHLRGSWPHCPQGSRPHHPRGSCLTVPSLSHSPAPADLHQVLLHPVPISLPDHRSGRLETPRRDMAYCDTDCSFHLELCPECNQWLFHHVPLLWKGFLPAISQLCATTQNIRGPPNSWGKEYLNWATKRPILDSEPIRTGSLSEEDSPPRQSRAPPLSTGAAHRESGDGPGPAIVKKITF